MPDTPESKLNKLKEDLRANETAATELKKGKDELNAQIAALEELVTAVKQVSATYDQAYEKMTNGKKNMEDYCQTKKVMIEAAIKDKDKKDTDAEIASAKKAIEDTVAAEKEQKKSFVKAEKEYKEAEDALNTKKDAYDSLLTLKKNIEDKLKELTDLKTQIENEEEEKHTKCMYFLIQEMEEVLSGTKIETTDNLKAALYKAGEDKNAADATKRAKETQLKTKKDTLTEQSNKLIELKSNRRSEILKKLKTQK